MTPDGGGLAERGRDKGTGNLVRSVATAGCAQHRLKLGDLREELVLAGASRGLPSSVLGFVLEEVVLDAAVEHAGGAAGIDGGAAVCLAVLGGRAELCARGTLKTGVAAASAWEVRGDSGAGDVADGR